MKYKVGTRGSLLALAQTNLVIDRLKNAYPDDSFETVVIRTTGDKRLDVSLDAIGGKGVFVDTIEAALQSGEIDMAVHSMKDMPDQPTQGLIFARTWEREDPRDVLIAREGLTLEKLPLHAKIGTGSRRRMYELRSLRPDLTIVPIRGNIDTRIRKMHEEKLDGIVLAAAGLKRIHRENEITQFFAVEDVIPAPAQGALAIELRERDAALLQKLDALSDETTARIVDAERTFLQEIGGDCHLPAGAYARVEADGTLTLLALFGDKDGSRLAQTSVNGKDAKAVAKVAADKLKRELGM